MSDVIQHIDLLDGLNLNPIPLEASQSMTTTKWLMAIQAKVNSIIDNTNSAVGLANGYTDDQIAVIQKEYDDLMLLLQSGNIIPNGSIDLQKLKPNFLTDLQDLILKYVHDSTKFVTFGLDDNGHFCADIPTSWDSITFSTDVTGHLCLTTD